MACPPLGTSRVASREITEVREARLQGTKKGSCRTRQGPFLYRAHRLVRLAVVFRHEPEQVLESQKPQDVRGTRRHRVNPDLSLIHI